MNPGNFPQPLVAAAGIGLIGSGVAVTDPMGGFPPVTPGEDGSGDAAPAEITLTREGKLHNLCAIPIFAGIPVAGLVSALVAARRTDYRWAFYSAGSSLVMVGSFLLFGASFGRVPRLAGKGGVFQRISVASGFGWLAVLSLRALIPASSSDILLPEGSKAVIVLPEGSKAVIVEEANLD